MKRNKSDLFYSLFHEYDDNTFSIGKYLDNSKPYVTDPILRAGQFTDLKHLEKSLNYISPNNSHENIVLSFSKQLNEVYKRKMYEILFEKCNYDRVSINWQAFLNKYI